MDHPSENKRVCDCRTTELLELLCLRHEQSRVQNTDKAARDGLQVAAVSAMERLCNALYAELDARGLKRGCAPGMLYAYYNAVVPEFMPRPGQF